MAEKAQVTSIEELDLFRAKLVVFLDRANGVLDGVGDATRRMKMWLDNDGRAQWEHELKRRLRRLEQAEAELQTAKLSSFKDSTQMERIQVNRAKESAEEAKRKLKLIKHWSLQFESRVEPLAKQTERLRSVVGYDMPKALTFLGEAVRALADYADIRPMEDGTRTNKASSKEEEGADADAGDGEKKGGGADGE